IAYEMLVGRVPFPVDPTDPYATVRAQMEESPPRPGRLVPGFPPLLEAALLWALEKPPERRPATAGELAAALRDALALSPTIGAYTEDGRRTPARGPDRTAAPGAPAPQPASGGAWRVPVALAATAAVAATAVLVLGARSRQPAAAAPAPVVSVTAISAVADPTGGTVHCPGGSVTLRATLATNGAAGTIRYEWLRPDGQRAGAGQVAVRAGQRSATIAQEFPFAGSAPAQGVAALHVLSPFDAYSEPVRITYACP
ncbi:MAG TPA: hypothetical protein VOB72_02225, partial [Candidatus Dormibacteraeota bacterium]|nr:hypothetical protein [Candidatus Dormibacteraeota bacterium]